MACFHKLTPIPEKDLNREKVIQLIAELRRSEVRKSQCGKDLLEWYDTVRLAYGQERPSQPKPLFPGLFKPRQQ
jgi:hypothetical protein